MRRLFLTAVVCILNTLLFSAGAYADANRILTLDEAKRFTDSLSPSFAFAKQMEKDGKTEYSNVVKNHLSGDDYNIYSQNMTQFKEKYPKDYEAFTVIVKQYGFPSCEEWASVGDAVMLAYLAGQEDMGKISEDMEKNMTPEVLANMPADLREKTQAAIAMVKAIKNVPAQNIKTVKSYAPAITEVTKDIVPKE